MPTIVSTPVREVSTNRNEVSFVEDFASFRRAYRAANASFSAGSNPLDSFVANPAHAPITVPRVQDNVGFLFGVELEFADTGRFSRSTFGEWMYSQNYTTSSHMRGYHSGRGETQHWRYEDDCSVSGGEVISPILRDNAASWEALSAVVTSLVEMGGSADIRTGGHIHVDTSELGNDLRTWQRFFVLYHAFEDVLYRLAANPLRNSGRTTPNGVRAARMHRGGSYSSPSPEAPGLRTWNSDLSSLISRYASHGSAINTENVSSRYGTGHVEFRLWDGSLDLGVIQTQVKVCAAIINAAMRDDLHDRIMALESEPRGSHRRVRRERSEQNLSRQRLSGTQWREDTLSIRNFCDILFTNRTDKEQVVTLFAMNSWNR
jgi:Putative amidoligase enzyme